MDCHCMLLDIRGRNNWETVHKQQVDPEASFSGSRLAAEVYDGLRGSRWIPETSACIRFYPFFPRPSHLFSLIRYISAKARLNTLLLLSGPVA